MSHAITHETDHPRPVHRKDGHWAVIIMVTAFIGYLAMITFMLATASTPRDTTPDRYPPMRACQTEDAPGPCYFDADVRGDRLGRDFVVDSNGRVILLTDD
jgi:hypothetical protein